MSAFLALLFKEFTLRRKSCCAILVNLILPLLLILIAYSYSTFTTGSAGKKPEKRPGIPPKSGNQCPNETYVNVPKIIYQSSTEMDLLSGMPKERLKSYCSFGEDRCPLDIMAIKRFSFRPVEKINQLSEATTRESLQSLCDYSSNSRESCTKTPEGKDIDGGVHAAFGLHLKYDVQNSVLDLTYYIGDSYSYKGEKQVRDNLNLLHLTVLNRVCLSLTREVPFPRVFFSTETAYSKNTQEDRSWKETGYKMVRLITMISLIVLVRHILYEKRSKLKDLIHMSGVGDFKYYASYFVIDVVILLVLNFLQLLINTTATLDYYLVIAAYSVAMTLFAISFTVFFTSETIGLLIFSLAMIFDLEPLEYLKGLPEFATLLIAIYPTYGLKFAFEQLDNRKTQDANGTTKNLDSFQLFEFDWEKNPTFLQPAFVLITIIFSWLFYSFVIFYVGEIWPWQSGTPRSLLFPLAKFSKLLKSKTLGPDKNAGSPEFEPEPKDLKVGIEVNNVRKRYGYAKLVLKGVFLKVYHGQISVLLGHNGAGKTTLMSIITGLESATSGKVIINGVDVDYEPTKARSGIGMCPQINSQYNDLTVRQHLQFFGMLKGYPRSMLNQEIYRVLDLVKLTDAEGRKSKALSGGMKRRLQLGMAFIGGSRMLILDEPSSGLDVEARRVVWDMLLAVKREYLIFMTTHHMEEADCLGDRVTIMHDGEIRCVGSPMFLKKVFGIGLTLRMSKGPDFKSKECLMFIQKYLQSARLTKETRTEVLYVFEKAEQPKLGQFFKELEPMRGNLGINSTGVAITTMDDVFVRVGEKFDAKKDDGSKGLSKLTIESGPKALKPTFINCFYGLLVKRFHATKRSKMFLLVIVLSLLFSILFGVKMFKSSYELVKGYKPSFELDDKFGYTCSPSNHPVCQSAFGDSSTEQSKHSAFAIKVKNDSENSSVSCLLLIPTEGHELDAISATFQKLLSANNLKVKVRSQINGTKPKIVHNIQLERPYLFIMWSMLLLMIPFRAVLSEKQTNVKLLQLMTGLSPVTYLFAHFVFDFILALVIFSPLLLFPPILYMTGANLVFNEISSAAFYYAGVFYFIFSSIIWSYIVSTLPLGPAAGLQLLIYYCFLSYIPGQQLALEMAVIQNNKSLPWRNLYFIALVVYWLLCLSPFVSFDRIIRSAFEVGDNGAFCKHLFEVFGRSNACNYEKLSNRCCKNTTSSNPWTILLEDKAALSFHRKTHKDEYLHKFIFKFTIPLILGAAVVVLFSLILLGLEYLTIMKRKRTTEAKLSLGEEDSDVSNERKATEKVLSENKQIDKALVVKDLTKKYGEKIVVNRLTVTIEKDQIFGFLGVNGAGKSTAFKMMVGEINRTGGEAYIGKYSLSEDFVAYRAQIGYCPQFDAFVTGLTGKEMLHLFALLRGVQWSQIKQTVNQMIELVDLKDHAQYVADNYSGGNKRKLSTAMALMGFPKVIFLDEPTAAVDPVARRKIWKVMEYAKKASGSSIVLTSHALDECEALCEKIVVMVAGRLKCLGSLQHLKEKFGQGLHITAKTKPGSSNLSQVEATIIRLVPSAKVVDSHTNVTIVRVTDPQVKIGDVYGTMEEIRSEFDLEDYQVEETNLEQIFLHFAKAAYK